MDNDEKVVDTPVDEKPVDTPVDALAEFKNSDGEFDPAKIQKLVEDKKYYRSQISKLKQMPEKLEEYGKDFVIDSKFDEFLQEEDNRKNMGDLLVRIDNMCLEKGIGIERNHDIKRFVLDELAKDKVYDITPLAEKKAREDKILAERNDAVQDAIGAASDLGVWNQNVLDWLKGFCNSEAEYAMHKKLFETNSLWALSLNKVRQAMMGNRIPVVQSQASFSQEEWDRTFHKATKEEQDKMLAERAKELTKYK